MGMSLGASAGGGGGRRRRRRKHAAMADINMTPFIDVMLVLLIIFMVAAPLLTAGVPLDLPQTSAKPINVDQKPLTVSINAQGRVYLNEDEVQPADVVARLKAQAQEGMDQRIYVRGAKSVNYGRVAEVMSLITAAGFKKVALITEPDQQS
ncbi:protein TolR [Chelatococcus asaccharovorans]|uniref:Cell division and transport-associated protein TolR n=1 Tax=Chelatococcus asaccharovorans TaxID=28210 RepID=A0A2V3UA54_9HYPH|nr:protein TolR [Chelatococcus asaccharovorans]MBS7705307.1 protein TolR [Chelatococcus asaccharovorans]PXW60290.1 cell division and transport-associated protein TolR [Chelatococcus asaccharovorans]CAH1654665.1 Ton complex subunit ExbD [Chelatococcus asaccharovorans]CAH1685681.1 Ton complex subunit ExbD [Chelatococcus asaccharovorans]